MNNFWNNKRVLITGHTGFKGSWLCLMLNAAGAKVTGYALDPPSHPSLFQLAQVETLLCKSCTADIRNFEQLSLCLGEADPEIIFHLAAQPIVRESYRKPVETFETNIMGTVMLLEAAKNVKNLKAVINITTDKCYENQEGQRKAFVEQDKLGGRDPYAASKACSEIITSSYRQSFFDKDDSPAIATARAGNVLGGGDWGKDRLLPDFFRAITSGRPFYIRNPNAVRPWQHVLDALNGYLTLAEKLYLNRRRFNGSWNIGSEASEYKSVKYVVEKIADSWREPVNYQFTEFESNLAEATFLSLDCSRAKEQLNWIPKWNINKTIDATVKWFAAYSNGENVQKLCLQEIEEFYQ